MRKFRIMLVAVVILLGVVAVVFLTRDRKTPAYLTTPAVRQEIRMTVSTNGVIEPVERSEVYAPIDGRVTRISAQEGDGISAGQLLMELESDQVRTALSEANAALLEARRQEQSVLSDPPGEEVAAIDATIDEAALQLAEIDKDLAAEESLLAQGAVARVSVDNLRKQRELLQLQLDGHRRRRQELLARHSPEEKQLERDRVRQLAEQAHFLEQQRRLETVAAPKSGVLYSLDVKPGAYVTRGQLLAQVNQPGKIRLRAYVDEPDLGRVAKGQPVVVTWDGLPDRRWTGVVERPAEQVVSMNNRTVGHVICSIDTQDGGDALRELIPNLNVKVEITTMRKADAVVVPRSAVFSPDGKQSVTLFDGKAAVTRQVVTGIVTAEDVEVLEGVKEGDPVVTNPLDAN
ncbi:MAG: HlyD family efflux transporter periplasmic adaptor subunit [Acidobacteriota bacterium]|jgi:HlyD family secretion protein|nr:HlyD family efflux transporter periplasmic adaptor subunit [Acidobacteriota bacterium]